MLERINYYFLEVVVVVVVEIFIHYSLKQNYFYNGYSIELGYTQIWGAQFRQLCLNVMCTLYW